MGDLANMTSVHGEVDGHRLLRWLRSRAEIHAEGAADCQRQADVVQTAWQQGRAELLTEMADDLERELTPPDYPEDDGDGVDLDDAALTDGPEAP